MKSEEPEENGELEHFKQGTYLAVDAAKGLVVHGEDEDSVAEEALSSAPYIVPYHVPLKIAFVRGFRSAQNVAVLNATAPPLASASAVGAIFDHANDARAWSYCWGKSAKRQHYF
eukprot:TRINITY_DN1532_c0_g2_i1.p1 TRINITY_DN1532_c0_g2~~TRINITY_DN1532_c0_g2_i1.p1  ORF type:complete len:115 (+),score=19.97 TRINITY_DN1532_c0_g2_i1:108-452(+)